MTAFPYPGTGATYVVEFDEPDRPPFAADLTFHDDATLTFVVTKGPQAGDTETLAYEATRITDDVWVVRWQEPNSITVVQVQDHPAERVVSISTFPDGRFSERDGSFRRRSNRARRGSASSR